MEAIGTATTDLFLQFLVGFVNKVSEIFGTEVGGNALKTLEVGLHHLTELRDMLETFETINVVIEKPVSLPDAVEQPTGKDIVTFGSLQFCDNTTEASKNELTFIRG
jgi:hypothetical protein